MGEVSVRYSAVLQNAGKCLACSELYLKRYCFSLVRICIITLSRLVRWIPRDLGDIHAHGGMLPICTCAPHSTWVIILIKLTCLNAPPPGNTFGSAKLLKQPQFSLFLGVGIRPEGLAG